MPGVLRTTLNSAFGRPINAANLKRFHAIAESGDSIGKMVLEGFQSVRSGRRARPLIVRRG